MDSTELDTDGTETETRTTRGRAPAKGRKVTQVTKKEFIEDPEEDDSGDDPDLPGILDLADVESRSVVRIRVIRKDPHEGMLGYLEDPNSSEQEIKEQWGGGTFRLEGINEHGKIVIARSIKLAGDPIFLSPASESQWRKSRGLPLTPSAAPDKGGMSVQEMMMFFREQEKEQRAADSERRRAEAEDKRAHEAKLAQISAEAETRRREDERDREERRRADDRERDERRRKDDAEREDRQRKATAEAEARQQSFMANMLAMIKQSAEQSIAFVKATTDGKPQSNQLMDAINTVVAIKTAFANESSGEEDGDPLNLLIKHGPAWLQGLGTTVGQAIRDVKGLPQLPPQQSPEAQAAAQPEPAREEGLMIPASSPLAPKITTLINRIAARGQDPEKVLSGVIDNMIQTVEGNPPPIRPPVAVQQAAPQSVIGGDGLGHTLKAEPVQGPVAAPKPAPAPKLKLSTEKTRVGSTRLTFS